MERDKRWRDAVIRLLVATRPPVDGEGGEAGRWIETHHRPDALRRVRRPLESAPWRERWPDRATVRHAGRARTH